jgi:uncharacterized protein (TIRG00374 family)
MSRVVLGISLGIATYLVFGAWGDFRRVGAELASFPGWTMFPVLALSLGNYLVRAWRWHRYLRVAGTRVAPGLSLGVFVSGLAMSVTPGKLGEVIKVGLLREAVGAPVARTFPVVVTERLADLLSVLVLAALGVARLGGRVDVLAAGVVLTAGMFAVLATRPGTRLVFRAAGVLLRKKVGPELAEEAAAVQRRLLAPGVLLMGVGSGVVAWFCEAAGFYLVVTSFPGANLTLEQAVFAYALGTLAGALSFLPGGLIATEAMLAGMLSPAVMGALPTEAAAIAATVLIRLATLWFAVALGVGGLLWTRRRIAARPAGSPSVP